MGDEGIKPRRKEKSSKNSKFLSNKNKRLVLFVKVRVNRRY